MNVVHAHDETDEADETERTPRARRRVARIEEILDTAERLLDADGMHALTMQRLAQALGTTVGATYRYFDSKDAILGALQRRVLEHLAADLERALARYEAAHPRASRIGALSRVCVAARTFASMPARRPTHARLLARMMAEPDNVLPPAIAEGNAAVALSLASAVVRELAAAREAGALGPGADFERAWLLWSSLSGLTQTKKLARWGVPGLELDALGERLVASLLVGWGAEPARAREAWARAGEVVSG